MRAMGSQCECGKRRGHRMLRLLAIFAGLIVVVFASGVGVVATYAASRTTMVGTVMAGRRGSSILASCSSTVSRCRVLVLLSVGDQTSQRTRSAYNRRLIVGSANVTLMGGQRHAIKVALNRAGRRLFAQRGAFRVKFTVTDKVVDAAKPHAEPPAPPQPVESPKSSPSPSSPSQPLNCKSSPGPKLPPPSEGVTSLVGGIYVFGGPPARSCAEVEAVPRSVAGTVEVLNTSTGEVVATRTVEGDQTFDIDVPPGEYTVIGTPNSSPDEKCQSNAVNARAGWSTDVEVVCSVP